MSKKSKLNYIDLFAGCGGLTDGFEQTGNFRLVAAVEWDPAACRTLAQRLRSRWGYTDAEDRVIRFDIQRPKELIYGWSGDPEYLSGRGLRRMAPKGEKVEVIIGGPPCQAYSVAGRIRDKHGMRCDYRNYLFESYLEVVRYFRPRIVVFENVPGMLSARPGGIPIIEKIKKAFKSVGYEITDDVRRDAVFDFRDYGVPQTRRRVILVGLRRRDAGTVPQNLLRSLYHEILPGFRYNKIRNVADAIGDLSSFSPLRRSTALGGRRFSHHPFLASVANHVPRYHNKRDIGIFRELAKDLDSLTGRYRTVKDLQELYTDRTGRTSNVHKYHVLGWDEPSNTVPAHLYKDGLRHIHPDWRQARSITVREAARLQTFDDEFEFLGSMGDQFKMIGNAVPPLFAKALGNAVYKLLTDLK